MGSCHAGRPLVHGPALVFPPSWASTAIYRHPKCRGKPRDVRSRSDASHPYSNPSIRRLHSPSCRPIKSLAKQIITQVLYIVHDLWHIHTSPTVERPLGQKRWCFVSEKFFFLGADAASRTHIHKHRVRRVCPAFRRPYESDEWQDNQLIVGQFATCKLPVISCDCIKPVFILMTFKLERFPTCMWVLIQKHSVSLRHRCIPFSPTAFRVSNSCAQTGHPW